MIGVIHGLVQFVADGLKIHRIMDELIIIGNLLRVNRLEERPRLLVPAHFLMKVRGGLKVDKGSDKNSCTRAHKHTHTLAHTSPTLSRLSTFPMGVSASATRSLPEAASASAMREKKSGNHRRSKEISKS